MHDFGVIVACYNHDYLFAKGTCASIRHGLGDIPITLLADNRFPTDDLKRTYGVNTLYREDIQNDYLREVCKGWGLPKMIAFWESPYDKFLYLDADTVVWGDLATRLKTIANVDIITDQPLVPHRPQDVSKWFFQTDRIEQLFPEFNWQKHTRNFFCTGVYTGTKGMFDLAEFKAMMDLAAQEPALFFPGEMGLLNLMIFRAADEGRLRVHQEPLQTICADYPREQLETEFPATMRSADPTMHAPTVLHYPGFKPLLRSQTHSMPMTYFRAQCLRDGGMRHPGAVHAKLQWEDLAFFKRQKFQGLKRRWARLTT